MAQGLTALDPRTAAASKFVEEKIQKGELQPDQVADFLLRMGADPRLAGLVFKYQRVEQAAKNQGQGQSPTTTVNQDVSNQYAQLKQQERMKQGLGGMSAPAIANAAMQGGITGEPVQAAAGGGLMRLAGGGPIAFDEGGSIPRNRSLVPYRAPFYKRAAGAALGLARRHPLGLAASLLGLGALVGDDEEQAVQEAAPQVEEVPEGMTDEQVRLLAAADAQRPATTAPGAGGAMPAMPKAKPIEGLSTLENRVAEAKARLPKDEQAAIDAELAREKPYLESIAARRGKIEEQEKKGTTSPEKKFWLAFAQAGFAASAKGARNLWETLSVGGVEGMKAYESMKDKEDQLRERLQDKMFQLDDLEAQTRRGATKAGIDRLDKARAEVAAAQSELAKTQVAVGLAERTESGAMYRAQLAQAGANQRAAMTAAGKQQLQKLENQYYADIYAAQRTTDPKLKAAYLRRAEDTRRAKAQLEQTESGYQSQAARLAAEEEIMRRARGQSTDDGFGDAEQVE